MTGNDRVLRKMSVGDVLDYSIEVYKRNAKKLTLLALIFFVPFMFVYTLVVSYISSEMAGFTKGNVSPGASASDFTYMLLAYNLILVVMVLVYFAYTVTLKAVMDTAVVRVVYSDVVNRTVQDLKSAIKEGFKKLPSLIANKILYGLILCGAVVAVYIVLIVVILIASFSTMPFLVSNPSIFSQPVSPVTSTILGIAAAILIIALVIGAVIFISFFITRFGFGVQAIIIEKKSAVEALSRSWKLSKKNFWFLFAVELFGYMIFFTVPILISAGAYGILFVNRSLYVVAATVTQIITSLIYPALTVLTTMLFINLKIKKEGLDLEVKVDELLEEQKRIDNY